MNEPPPVYLDYNATAVPMPGLSQVMNEVAETQFGNPSSLHHAGRMARDLLENARRRLAELLGVAYQDLTFTSGGSETNNAVLRQFLMTTQSCHVITSQIEHPSILETCRVLEQMPHLSVTYLDVNQDGIVEPDVLHQAIRENTQLISIMTANNETGAIQPIRELAQVAHDNNIQFHTDSVQAVGKIPVDWVGWGVTYATATAHKIGGPRGIGLLYTRPELKFEALVTGGKQERVRRAGTESVMLAHGYAAALAWALHQQETVSQRLEGFKQHIRRTLETEEGFFVNSALVPCLPNTINFGFANLSAESILISLDLEGIAISTGSACSSGAIEASHVLMAMGLTKKQAKSCLRISMGWNTTQTDVDRLLDRIRFHVKRLYEKKRHHVES